jgi:hypothetical protein
VEFRKREMEFRKSAFHFRFDISSQASATRLKTEKSEVMTLREGPSDGPMVYAGSLMSDRKHGPKKLAKIVARLVPGVVTDRSGTEV